MTFDDDQAERLGTCLRRLELHVEVGAIALAGSVAIEVHLAAHNLIGKSCLYFKSLADLHISVLEQLVVGSIAEARRLYG